MPLVSPVGTCQPNVRLPRLRTHMAHCFYRPYVLLCHKLRSAVAQSMQGWPGVLFGLMAIKAIVTPSTTTTVIFFPVSNGHGIVQLLVATVPRRSNASSVAMQR